MKRSEPSIIDRSALPALYPTQTHSPQFWEQLGRTIATFGFLEEILGKAIYAFTGTRIYSPEVIEGALNQWGRELERALQDPLKRLADSYGLAVKHRRTD